MGLLDDAIREHLELKKRHGASEDEVSKLETEAFGPGRLPAPAAPPEAESPGEEEPAPLDPPAPEPVPVIEPDPKPEPVEEPLPPAAVRAEFDDEPARPTPAPAPATEAWLEDDEPDEVPAAESLEHGTQEEDVLEETPDFLQETPDHDRLWFEQKPPRDFDFD